MGNMETVKKDVLRSNKDLVERGLVIKSFGNVSQRFNQYCVIKPSGINLNEIKSNDMVSVNIGDGGYDNSSLKPSSDTPTHLELYKKYKDIDSIVHTHSKFATSWAQSGLSIPCLGTTHADYYEEDIPVTRSLTDNEIKVDYEKNTGLIIIETIENLKINISKCPGVLVFNHGVFSWGKSPHDAVENANLIEYIAEMAFMSLNINSDIKSLNNQLHKKHYDRKHGKEKYYGQE